MCKMALNRAVGSRALAVVCLFLLLASDAPAQEGGGAPQGPPPVPVRVAAVLRDAVSEQVTLVGTTEAVARSVIAAEVSGIVEVFPVREGDFVKKGDVLVRLRSTDLDLRLKAAVAAMEKVRSSLQFAEKELARYTKLKDADSVAASRYDEALYQHQSLEQDLARTEAEVEMLKDNIANKTVVAPFAGFVAEEQTQVGEWLPVGGPVVTLVDLGHILITVDMPERYVSKLLGKGAVHVVVSSVSEEPIRGGLSAVLPEGDTAARTFPVRVRLENKGFRIKSGMEARATFNLETKKEALLVPKDAIVTAGTDRMVYVVAGGAAQPAMVQVNGYFEGNVAVEGAIKPGDQVVIRGNERLRPGQPVQILE